MKKKTIILVISAAIALTACQSQPASETAGSASDTEAAATGAADAASTGETTESASETEADTAGTTQSESPASTAISKMDELSDDATIDELITAFQEDYVRAAEQAGIEADHNDLSYEVEDPEMVTIDLDSGLMLIFQNSAASKMVWYAGYPADESSFQQEMQLVLMAADNTLTPEEAKTCADDIWNEAWDNRNNMPSAVQQILPSGLLYTMSLNDRLLVSFQVMYLNQQ